MGDRTRTGWCAATCAAGVLTLSSCADRGSDADPAPVSDEESALGDQLAADATSEAGEQLAANNETAPPIGSAAPIDDAAALSTLLDTVGLEFDRSVPLPGNDEMAFVVVVPGESAIEAWTSLRTLVPSTGRYPVIVGGPIEFGGEDDTALEQTLASGSYLVADTGTTTESELAAASELDLVSWFDSRATYLGATETDLDADSPLPEYDFPKDRFTSNVDLLSGEPLPVVEIVLLPTNRSWEAPIYLMWGGWNDVPLPHELTAIFKHWSETYGAEVVAMTGDVVEMSVAAPPNSDITAIQLAREHFLVAPDNVWQGTGDLDVLAAAVRDAPVWFFWWD